MDTMSSNGKGGPHNTKKGKGVAADQPKRWLGDCPVSFGAALAEDDDDDDDRLFSASDDNVDAHGTTDLVSFPTELVDYVVNETDHAHVPIPFQARNDVVLAAPPYSRSAGSDASVNSYAVNAGEAEVGDDDDHHRRHERDNGLFEELWEVVDAGRWRRSEK